MRMSVEAMSSFGRCSSAGLGSTLSGRFKGSTASSFPLFGYRLKHGSYSRVAPDSPSAALKVALGDAWRLLGRKNTRRITLSG